MGLLQHELYDTMIFGRSRSAPAEEDRPKRVLVFGNSVAWGWVPQPTFIPSQRFPAEDQWPRVMGATLGPGYEVIIDALSGRTTDVADPLVPQVPGVGLNGIECLPATLVAHLPLDLVVLALGSNDFKPQFGRSAFRVALGAGMLIDTIQELGNLYGTLWYTYPPPAILLLCPPPFAKPIKAARELFEGAEKRAQGLATAYAHVAAAAGVAFVDAGTIVQSDGIDGVHLTAKSQRKLGAAMAGHVADLLG